MSEQVKVRGRTQSPQHHVWATEEDQAFQPFRVETGGGSGTGRGGAVLVSEDTLDHLPVSIALSSASIPAGPLLREVQGQQVLAMARAMAARLSRSMARDGRAMSSATESEAIGAGAGAVVAWRNGAVMDGADRGAAGVCWRAIVASVASDGLGESIEAWRQDESGADCWDSLTGSALPLPGMVGDGSRAERASRLLFERARAKRGALLARRVEVIKGLGGRGKRAELIDKVQRAAVLLLHGESVDQAAMAAGFKASGSGRQAVRGGDRLMQAVRRLGFRVQFNLRQVEAKERDGRGGACVPLSPETIKGLSVNPSETLSPQRGRGSKQRVPLMRRLQRARLKRERVTASRKAWLTIEREHNAKRNAKRQTLDRRQRRAHKALGCYPLGGSLQWFDIVAGYVG